MKLIIDNRQRKFAKSQVDTYTSLLERVFEDTIRRDFTDKILKKEDVIPEVTVIFVGESGMKEINESQRGIRRVTDVLSFPMLSFHEGSFTEKPGAADYVFREDGNKTLPVGEILICLSKAQKQSAEYGHSMEREVAFLFLHGLLHLLGYDHERKEDEKKMISQSEKILADLNIHRNELEETLDHVGFVAVLGRPNVGKSTLINQLSGMKLAIVSSKPQTTRTRIRSVINTEKSQLIFLDTPGIHKPKTALSNYMVKTSFQAAEDGDVILFLVDALKGKPSAVEKEVCQLAQKSKKKIVLAINKADAIEKEELLPLIQTYYDLYPFEAIIPISARTGDGVSELLKILENLLPAGHLFYGRDEITDQSERMLASELVREQLLRHLNEEVPHGTAVEIEDFQEIYEDDASDEYDRRLIRIKAAIYCDRSTHKGIILGKKGQMIKSIGSKAREAIEEMCECKVYLELFVKVREDWKNKDNFLKVFGYSGKG